MCIKWYLFDDTGLLSASAMGLWHGVEYYEKEKIVGEEYYQQWSNVSNVFPIHEYIHSYSPTPVNTTATARVHMFKVC